MRVITVVGARPQFIKAVVVSAAMARATGVEETLVHTGQHYDPYMSDVFFDELDIPQPAVSLGIGSGSHGDQTGRMLAGLEQVFLEHVPDAVLVYGDTNSTMAAALAAAKLHIPVAHVEAGLRSFNRRMPEEINRVVTDHVSDLLFAPTAHAARNLRVEGVTKGVHIVGDVMYDTALHFRERAERRSTVLDVLQLEPKGFILATLHRAENTDVRDRLAAALDGLGKVAREVPVVLPLHPRTRDAIARHGLTVPDSLTVVEPLGYLDMVSLEMSARVIATDSGGVQKEAFFYRVPCVTLRDETEWVELVEAGWNRLAPPLAAGDVVAAIEAASGSVGKDVEPFGDGDSADVIVSHLIGS